MDTSGEESSLRNGRGSRKNNQFIPCISKDLYDEPPQSDVILLQMFFNILHKTFILLSKFRMGQVIISILDYYMIKIENTLDFCLPDNSDFAAQRVIDKHKRELSIQDRPMSWLFFIPALIFLRIFRFTLSVYCILAGKGEITAQHMQSKVIDFRRYYRSIRHYGVDTWTEEYKEVVNERKKWLFWRFYYRIYEFIFMTKPIVENHHLQCSFNDAKIETSNKRPKRIKKQSLNVNSTDDDLNANKMLEKYADIEDSLTVDPDYDPSKSKELNETVEDTDSDEVGEEEDLSLRKLDDESTVNLGENSQSDMHHSSPVQKDSDEQQSDSDKRSPPENGIEVHTTTLSDIRLQSDSPLKKMNLENESERTKEHQSN